MSYSKIYRRYTITILTLTTICLALIAGVNGVIDPYEAVGTPRITGFNHVKREKNNQVRLFKTLAVNRIEAKSLFLGSSRTEFGLDTHHPALKQNQPGYNLAITGANMYEVRRYFDHAIATQPEVRDMVLGLDFFMFNQTQSIKPDFNENRLEVRRIILEDLFNVLFSQTAFIASLKTLKTSIESPDSIGYFYPDGRREPSYYIQHIYFNQQPRSRFRVVLQDFLERPDLYGNYQLSVEALEDLKAIITTSQQRGIRLKIFISPSHAMQWEAIRVAGLWSEFEQWKREVVNLSPLWDFSGYNSITTEAIGHPMEYYIESSHYRKEVGDLVLNRILGYQLENVPSDFGILLTPANLETHLEQIRQSREVWANNHPEWVEFVEELTP